jgi:chromosome segregation ATPase
MSDEPRLTEEQERWLRDEEQYQSTIRRLDHPMNAIFRRYRFLEAQREQDQRAIATLTADLVAVTRDKAVLELRNDETMSLAKKAASDRDAYVKLWEQTSEELAKLREAYGNYVRGAEATLAQITESRDGWRKRAHDLELLCADRL